mmetsp:Transcript_20381/g.47687  ORF Transcript_20381/g.47687 Transcript_20381/m.47687 type:complete len:229 (-) Transcript_20381:179-865(-)
MVALQLHAPVLPAWAVGAPSCAGLGEEQPLSQHEALWGLLDMGLPRGCPHGCWALRGYGYRDHCDLNVQAAARMNCTCDRCAQRHLARQAAVGCPKICDRWPCRWNRWAVARQRKAGTLLPGQDLAHQAAAGCPRTRDRGRWLQEWDRWAAARWTGVGTQLPCYHQVLVALHMMVFDPCRSCRCAHRAALQLARNLQLRTCLVPRAGAQLQLPGGNRLHHQRDVHTVG